MGADQSPAMVARAQSRLAQGVAVVADTRSLPFADHAFKPILAEHFYGRLTADERQAFLSEARRVADELIVIDSALRTGIEPEQWQERILNDGSCHRVYRRYPTGLQAVDELGGQVLFDGTWFVAARVRWARS